MWRRSPRSGATPSTTAWPTRCAMPRRPPGWPASTRWPRASNTPWAPTTAPGNDDHAQTLARRAAVLLAAPDHLRLLPGHRYLTRGHRLPGRDRVLAPQGAAPAGLARHCRPDARIGQGGRTVDTGAA